MRHLLLTILIITGCATPEPVYLPPTATDAEIYAAKVSTLEVELPIVPKRSKAEMAVLYEKAQRSIYPAALSVCKKLGEIDSQKCVWSFDLKQDEVINAYASGENNITFNTGLIENWVGYQEELNFVLAHEMAHHIANHINEGTKRINTGVLIGGIIGAALAQRTEDEEEQLEMLGDGVKYGAQLANLVYSVESEQEADLIALEILKLSGTNLERARNVIVRMVRDSKGPSRSSFTDTHPTGLERLAAYDKASLQPVSIKVVSSTEDRSSQEGYQKAYFEKALGSYCIYVSEGKKFPFPMVTGCPPIKYIKK